jgi:hypothetical protein
MKRIARTIILTTVFALALAAPASAEQVDAAASSADCTKVTAKYKGFASTDKPVAEKITVDGTVVYNKSGFTWSGSDYTHVIYYPTPLLPGSHTVVFTATWATSTGSTTSFTRQVSCPGLAKVNTSTSTVDCSKVGVRYESFLAADLPIAEKIVVDGATVYNKSGFSFLGSSTTHEISYPTALTPGTHTVVFTASWLTQLTNPNTFTRQITCAGTSKVDLAASTADCAEVSVRYESFLPVELPITETIAVDGTTVYDKSGFSFLGSSTTHEISYPTALTPGSHTVVFTASWLTQGTNPSTFTVHAYCAPPPISFGCDGEVVDVDHPAAICPSEVVPVPVPMVSPKEIVCQMEGKVVLFSKRSKILTERVYVDGRLVAVDRANAYSNVTKFALPGTGEHYSLKIVARLKNRAGRRHRWSKTVDVQRCGDAVPATVYVPVGSASVPPLDE